MGELTDLGTKHAADATVVNIVPTVPTMIHIPHAVHQTPTARSDVRAFQPGLENNAREDTSFSWILVTRVLAFVSVVFVAIGFYYLVSYGESKVQAVREAKQAAKEGSSQYDCRLYENRRELECRSYEEVYIGWRVLYGVLMGFVLCVFHRLVRWNWFRQNLNELTPAIRRATGSTYRISRSSKGDFVCIAWTSGGFSLPLGCVFAMLCILLVQTTGWFVERLASDSIHVRSWSASVLILTYVIALAVMYISLLLEWFWWIPILDDHCHLPKNRRAWRNARKSWSYWCWCGFGLLVADVVINIYISLTVVVNSMHDHQSLGYFAAVYGVALVAVLPLGAIASIWVLKRYQSINENPDGVSDKHRRCIEFLYQRREMCVLALVILPLVITALVFGCKILL